MPRTDLLRGTLDLLILQALTLDRNHGLGVARRVEQITQGAFQVNPGSLFPSLYRLEQDGKLKAEWRATENKRRAKYYQLTASGRKQLEQHRQRWTRVSFAVASVLEGA